MASRSFSDDQPLANNDKAIAQKIAAAFETDPDFNQLIAGIIGESTFDICKNSVSDFVYHILGHASREPDNTIFGTQLENMSEESQLNYVKYLVLIINIVLTLSQKAKSGSFKVKTARAEVIQLDGEISFMTLASGSYHCSYKSKKDAEHYRLGISVSPVSLQVGCNCLQEVPLLGQTFKVEFSLTDSYEALRETYTAYTIENFTYLDISSTVKELSEQLNKLEGH